MHYDLLKLDNQICFPLYAASRMMTKLYQPLLSKLNLTYPQYLVMMVLWEQNEVCVKSISEKLMLESNTLTPLLKRLESSGLLERERSKQDERKVFIHLTEKGKALREQAMEVPVQLIEQIASADINLAYLEQFKNDLDRFLTALKK